MVRLGKGFAERTMWVLLLISAVMVTSAWINYGPTWGSDGATKIAAAERERARIVLLQNMLAPVKTTWAVRPRSIVIPDAANIVESQVGLLGGPHRFEIVTREGLSGTFLIDHITAKTHILRTGDSKVWWEEIPISAPGSSKEAELIPNGSARMLPGGRVWVPKVDLPPEGTIEPLKGSRIEPPGREF